MNNFYFGSKFDYNFGKYRASKNIEEEILKLAHKNSKNRLFRKCVNFINNYDIRIKEIKLIPTQKKQNVFCKIINTGSKTAF